MVGLGGSFKHHFIRPSQGAQAYPESLQFNPTATYPESAASNTNIGKFAYIRLDNNPFTTNINRNEITVSFWMYPEKLVNETSLGSENHQIYWVYDPTNNSGNFGRMALHSSGIDWKHRSISVADSGSFNFNQWNHVLMSMKRDDTTVTSGHGGGSLNTTTNRDTFNRTTPDDRIHLVINGVAQHRYVQPNTAGQTDGFFQNDFRTGTAGDALTFGNVTINTATTELFTGNSSEDCYFGTQYNNGYGHDAYKGSIYQFWAKNQYYDLTSSSNIALFYNSGASVSSLPSNPIIYFSGGSRISSGTYNPGSSGVYQNRITASSQTNP
jgi:hypothetical protein